MQSYDDMAEMAGICAKNAHLASTREVAAELWKIAKEYQEKAAALDSGKLPDIGKPPRWITE